MSVTLTVLVALFPLVFYCTGLQFSPRLQKGAVVYTCANSELSLPWEVNISGGESIHDVQWYHAGRSQQIIATMANGFFFAAPAYSGRVQRTTNAGIAINHVTSLEAGNYSVELTGRQGDGGLVTLRGWVSVHISDSLPTSDGEIQVSQQTEAEWSSVSGQYHIVLKCGHFLQTTQPPLDLHWTTPTGEKRSSTSYKDGYFRLELPNPVQEGAYMCSLTPSHDCHHNQTWEATLRVSQMDARITLLEAQVGARVNTTLQSEVNDLKAEVLHLRDEVNHLRGAVSGQGVSFHARLNDSLFHLPPLSVVVMSKVMLNEGGAYNGHTGIFTAPYHGTYVFMASAQPPTANLYAILTIVVDRYEELDYVYLYSDAHLGAGGVQAAVELRAGQKVWLACNGDSNFLSISGSFTGFLLHRQP